LPFSPAGNGEAHWLTEMIDVFAHTCCSFSTFALLVARVGSFLSAAIAGVGSDCEVADELFEIAFWRDLRQPVAQVSP